MSSDNPLAPAILRQVTAPVLRSVFFIALLVSLLLLSACAEQYESKLSSITLQRTACFGVCPVYTVTIYPDGLVEFHGERFVTSLGDYTGRVPAGNFRQLAAFAEEIGFQEMEKEYRVRIEPDGTVIRVSDLPSRITTLKFGDSEKTVLNYFAGPEQLERFELLIDELSESARWIGNEPPAQ